MAQRQLKTAFIKQEEIEPRKPVDLDFSDRKGLTLNPPKFDGSEEVRRKSYNKNIKWYTSLIKM